MKKLFAIVTAIMCLTTNVAAGDENWVFVSDTNEGGRVLIDANHINKNPKTKSFGKSRHLKFVIEGDVRFVNEPKVPDSARFHIKIDDELCLKYRHGDLWFHTSADKPGVEHHEYWDASGNKTFDTVGNWMCDYARAVELKIDENGNPIDIPKNDQDSTPVPDPTPNSNTETF